MVRLKKNKVNFLVAGAQKSGTSALDFYLRQHHEVRMARRKECHFFNRDEHFTAQLNYAPYHRLFPDLQTEFTKGECTPAYMYWHQAMPRIQQYNPQMNIIAVLRNPIQRAFSAWNMEVDRGNETLSFMAAIKTENDRCRSSLPQQHKNFAYLDRGFYSEQIRRIWRCFPVSQTHFIKFDDLKANPQTTFNQLCDFLQISPIEHLQLREVNCTPYPRSMTAEEWDFLYDLYQFEIKQTAHMLGWDCDDWLNKPFND